MKLLEPYMIEIFDGLTYCLWGLYIIVQSEPDGLGQRKSLTPVYLSLSQYFCITEALRPQRSTDKWKQQMDIQVPPAF